MNETPTNATGAQHPEPAPPGQRRPAPDATAAAPDATAAGAPQGGVQAAGADADTTLKLPGARSAGHADAVGSPGGSAAVAPAAGPARASEPSADGHQPGVSGRPDDAERAAGAPALDRERPDADRGRPDVDEDRAEADRARPADREHPGAAPVRPTGRFSSASLVIALLLGVLGFALVVQLRSNNNDQQLSAARTDDLVRLLSDLDARQTRLRTEIADLQDTQRQLASGADAREAALAEARRRADEMGILAGTLPAQGSGVTVQIVQGNERLKASLLLDIIEELRGAGAEAMEIAGGGHDVRIVASTSFVDGADGLVVDGRTLPSPYTITAIGDPQTLRTAMNIPGGVVDVVRQRGGNVMIQESGTVRVDALHDVSAPRYAKPVS